MHMTGNVPEGFDAVDKGEFAKISFSLLSTYIVPDLTKSLMKSMAGGGAINFRIDGTLTGDLKGVGLTFEWRWDQPPRPYRMPEL